MEFLISDTSSLCWSILVRCVLMMFPQKLNLVTWGARSFRRLPRLVPRRIFPHFPSLTSWKFNDDNYLSAGWSVLSSPVLRGFLSLPFGGEAYTGMLLAKVVLSGRITGHTLTDHCTGALCDGRWGIVHDPDAPQHTSRLRRASGGERSTPLLRARPPEARFFLRPAGTSS